MQHINAMCCESRLGERVELWQVFQEN